MAQINVNQLSFYYEGSSDMIFEDVSFSVDTGWKLGFVGRNGKGKTTFLRLLQGKEEYRGHISTDTVFDYFPYETAANEERMAAELMEEWKRGVESWRVLREMDELRLDAELLYRPFNTLSGGEKTKIMLAVLFSGENEFLLVDEPTNHLDQEARDIVKEYLSGKKGFILVSHDRDLLDACIDHVLVLNRSSIEVRKGNFSDWWENKEKTDTFNRSENEKHLREIGKLKESADRTSRWAEKSENSKIGFDPVKEHDHSLSTRSYIGAKTKKMQSRVKSFEKRIGREIEEKEGLLKDIEEPVDLKLMPLEHYKKRLVEVRDLSLSYGDGEPVCKGLNFEIVQGDRIFLCGENGCGKSSVIRAILNHLPGFEKTESLRESGELTLASNLVVSYISQTTSHLKGKLQDFVKANGLDLSLMLALLRQLDMERVQFEKNMEDFSEGQKKKVLIAASLMTPAHLYIWDEPLNYIDVFSRMQIEKLIETYHPTMLLVEHDVRFRDKLNGKTIDF